MQNGESEKPEPASSERNLVAKTELRGKPPLASHERYLFRPIVSTLQREDLL